VFIQHLLQTIHGTEGYTNSTRKPTGTAPTHVNEDGNKPAIVMNGSMCLIGVHKKRVFCGHERVESTLGSKTSKRVFGVWPSRSNPS
jgi:hypothetical protein